MARTQSPSTSHQTVALQKYYRDLNLSFVLGYTNNTDKIENAQETYSDAVANSSIALRVEDSEIRTVVKAQSGNARWIDGVVPGKWRSSGDNINGQHIFQHNDMVFMVLGFDGNRRDLEGSIISRNPFTNISGLPALSPDGILYCAINASSSLFNVGSRKYIDITLAQEEFVNKLESSASLSTRATNICGSGNEQAVGSCCLYHKEAGYDSVAGVTFDSGDFYKCDCTKCYKCIELADAFNMNYSFIAGTGGTGSGCVSCDSETFPTDCGPCGCTMDWNSDTSPYRSVINNSNINAVSSTKRFANIVNTQNNLLSGSVITVDIDLDGLDESARTLNSAYVSEKDAGTLKIPFIGSCSVEATVSPKMVQNGVTKDWMIAGIEMPTANGLNYTSCKIDEEEWLKRFPNIPVSRLEVNVSPIGGFGNCLASVLDLSLVVSKIVKKSDITGIQSFNSSATQKFNFYTLASLFDSNNASIYAGFAEEQPSVMSLVPEFDVYNGSAEEAQGSEPAEREVVKNKTTSAAPSFNNTTTEYVVSFSTTKKGVDTEATFGVQTPSPDDLIGVIVQTEEGDSWEVQSIASRAYGSTGVPYDPYKMNIIHRNATTINLDNTDYSETFRFDIQIGTGSDQAIYGTS